MATATKRKKAEPTTKAVVYPTDGLARVSEAGQFLSVARETVYRMIRAEELEFVLVHDTIRIPWAALHRIAKSAAKKNPAIKDAG